jgi:hypothetical protein
MTTRTRIIQRYTRAKFFSLPLNISRFVLNLLQQHCGAAETALGGKCDADNIVNDTHVQKLDQRPQQKG